MYGHGVKADRDKAISLIEPVAKQGEAYAQRILGICYHLKADETKAREFYELAAKQSDIEAQYSLANSYTQGYYSAPIDYSEAAKWYKKAARNGHPEAKEKVKELTQQ